MAVAKARTRMVTVRFSEDEYIALKNLCLATGARNISRLTRDALQSLLNKPGFDNELAVQLGEIKFSVKTLEARVRKLESHGTSPNDEDSQPVA